MGDGPCEVSLRSPIPLERELAVERDDDVLLVRDGDTLVARAQPGAVEVEPPQPVSPAQAAEASAAGLERWRAGHPFPGCVGCGPDRAPGDGLRIFPAALGDGRFAADWTPDDSLAGDDGFVLAECIWAALDCPTSAPVANYGDGPPIVLGSLAGHVEGPVRVGQPHALVSWELRRDGRKRHAACALFDERGTVLARSRALWIELQE